MSYLKKISLWWWLGLSMGGSMTAALLKIMHLTPALVQGLFVLSFVFGAVFLLRLVLLLNRLSKIKGH